MEKKFDLGFITRQKDIIPPEKLGMGVNVVGAGAIGSHSIMALARMGFGNITVFDFDEVDPLNMNCQGYGIDDIGKPKVECLARHVKNAVGFDIRTINKAWENENLGSITICAADSMDVRKQMFEQCTNASYYIDPRMGAEIAQLYVVDMKSQDSKDNYVKSLFPDSEAVRQPCTAKSTIYTAYLLSGLVVKAVKDIVMQEPYTFRAEWNIRKNQAHFFNKD